MENAILAELENPSQEIFDLDIPELRDDEDYPDGETWNAFLNSKWDF